MSEEDKTREQLIDELTALKKKIAGLEETNNKHKDSDSRYNKLVEEVDTALSMADVYTHDIERLVAERTTSLIALNIADRMTNPAVVIGMMCRRMLKNNLINKETQYRLEVILKESEKLQEIIQEFNDLIEKRESVFSYDDLNGIVREAVVLIERQAEAKGVKLVTSLSEMPLNINMEKNVLRTAILYIFKNALEATPRGGVIKAATTENGDSVYLNITDTGCGISEEYIERVFDRFFTTKVDGAGMGLPFVKHIIEEHYGDIKIESEKGIGTKFTIKFPVRWLHISEGKLGWEHPMLPVPREREEYPLQTETVLEKPSEDIQK